MLKETWAGKTDQMPGTAFIALDNSDAAVLDEIVPHSWFCD